MSVKSLKRLSTLEKYHERKDETDIFTFISKQIVDTNSQRAILNLFTKLVDGPFKKFQPVLFQVIYHLASQTLSVFYFLLCIHFFELHFCSSPSIVQKVVQSRIFLLPPLLQILKNSFPNLIRVTYRRIAVLVTFNDKSKFIGSISEYGKISTNTFFCVWV